MKIILLRHGRPEVSLRQRVRASDLPRLAQAYRQAGIIDSAPEDSINLARQSTISVCSNLRRSVESARALGLDNIFYQDGLFAEADLPYVSFPSPSLPAWMWAAFFRLAWSAGFSRNAESRQQVGKRVEHATERLMQLAEQHGDVLLVGHGMLNYLIAKQLKATGWDGKVKTVWRHWQYSVFEK